MEKESPNPPWGQWEVLLEESDYKVKRIIVLPGKRLSYQRHSKRAEHWIIVKGQALVVLDEREIPVEAGQVVEIPQGAAHRIGNCGKEPLIFVEVQRGKYLGEDDIIRLEDDYGRTGISLSWNESGEEIA